MGRVCSFCGVQRTVLVAGLVLALVLVETVVQARAADAVVGAAASPTTADRSAVAEFRP